MNSLARCFNCKHFHRGKSWSVGLSEDEVQQASLEGVELETENGITRRLTEISKDGVCLQMAKEGTHAVDRVHYQTTSGDQWNSGVSSPRVGENFGCIHFSSNTKKEVT